jgi:hypothetical protein
MRCAMSNNAVLRPGIHITDGGAHRTARQEIACEEGD